MSKFCIMPWVHTHTWPNGDVFPCCLSNVNAPFGKLEDNNFEDIWNGEEYKQFRLDMMNGVERSDICKRCYEVEDRNQKSTREDYNNRYNDVKTQLLSNTNEDGSAPLELKYWDFRFNNTCNLSCRTCSPYLSSSWANDYELIHDFKGEEKFKIFTPSDLQYKQLIDDQINNVDKIYFAGGEPLIIPEHKHILDRLIELNKTDVELNYNTNLSTLSYKGTDFLEVWKKFDSVCIGVSIDEIEDRAEYWRNGTNWKVMLSNMRKLSDAAKKRSNLKIMYSPTISVFNINRYKRLFEFLFIENDLIGLKTSVSFNVLTEPKYYDMRIASTKMKLDAMNSLDELTPILAKYCNDTNKEHYTIISGIKKTLFSEIENRKELLEEFTTITAKLDKIRNQSVKQVAPEIYEQLIDEKLYTKIYNDTKRK